MSQIESYEPEFVRQYLQQQPATGHAPVSIHWQHETRRSLLLNDYHSCEAVLGKAEAFHLRMEMTEADGSADSLAVNIQVLNQAALDIATLPDISNELRLYALGVMLSCAQKTPDDLEAIKALPAQLAAHASSGTLQTMFEQLPALHNTQRQLITRLGSLSFEWDNLVDCPRKLTLPLQINLLSLQDGNSEALMQKQLLDSWETHSHQAFITIPWVWTYYLVYRLYHDTFPQHQNLTLLEVYLELVSDYFLLRSLFSFWMMDGSALTNEQTYSLFSVYEAWRLAYPEERLALHHPALGDELLTAFSLLTR
ncbi:lysine-N-methylase [Enterobacteriaceae bacterium H16N7]|nr:lysine-N-methylase [Dryocola clanedunensis]